MSYQPGLSASSLWLEKIAARWETFRAKLPKLPTRWVVLLSMVILAAIAFLIRCLHLFNSNYYYIVSSDSYFFHWVARDIMAGEPPPAVPGAEGAYALHSGLSYPLAYIAKAASSVFGLSSADALDLVSKFLPPVLAVISIVLIYLAAARICGRRVGLFTAFAWAMMAGPVVFGAAGYLDRDGLSMLLFMTGAFLFYLSGLWHFRVGNRDVGWLIAGVGVLVVEAVLYLEWSFVGPVLLLAVLIAYSGGRALLEYLDRLEAEPSAVRRLAGAISKVNWRAFALVILGNVVIIAVMASLNPQQLSSWFDFAVSVVQAKGYIAIAEMQGLSLGDLSAFQLFIIPMGLGLYLAWKKRAESSIFFSCWFLGLLILAIFAKRVLLYAMPAACLLSGVGLAFLWDWLRQGQWHTFKTIGVAVAFFLAIVLAFSSAYSLASVPSVAASQEWQDGLEYLREETPGDSVIMSQWSWGYWILDLGQRRPLVDNGYYGFDSERLRDVGLAYSTTDPAEAARIMKKYGAGYLVFTSLDKLYEKTIMKWTDVSEDNTYFPGNSLVLLSLNGEFESGGGLQVVYRSVPRSGSDSFYEPEVVILALTQSGIP